MARYWPTVLLTGIFAGLGLYVYYVELPAQRSDEKQEKESQRLLTMDESDIAGLTVKTEAGEVALQQGRDQNWRIIAPIQTEADKRQVQGLIRALVTGRVKRVVEEQGGSLEAFGLSRPSTRGRKRNVSPSVIPARSHPHSMCCAGRTKKSC